MFVTTHPAEFVANAMDVVFCEGANGLLRLCLRFIAAHSEMVLAADDGYELAFGLKMAAYAFFSCQALFEVLNCLVNWLPSRVTRASVDSAVGPISRCDGPNQQWLVSEDC